MTRDDRPNILLVTTDQQSASAMSCAGNEDLHTPAMDRLAEEGVLFRHAYTTNPLCTPCRGSLFTGMMPLECGTPSNGMGIRPELRHNELGNVLARAGYECLYGGKWHVPEGTMPEDNDHGFRTFCGRGDDAIPPACDREFERAAAASPSERRPFFMAANFVNPHDVCQIGRGQVLPQGGIGHPPPVEECPNLPANFAISPFEPGVLREEQAGNWSCRPLRNASPEDWRRLRWGYFRLVEKVDALIGQVLDALAKRGLDRNTLVLFTSDHGDGHGAHQWNQKSVLYEEVVRVPMIMRPPGGVRGGVVSDFMVSNGLDVFPTVCACAGVPVPEGLRGANLLPAAEGRAPDPGREAVFVQTSFGIEGRRVCQGRAVRTQRWKYNVYDSGPCPEQLFDLHADPGEMVNRAVEAKFRPVLEEHRRLLVGQLQETSDPFQAVFMQNG